MEKDCPERIRSPPFVPCSFLDFLHRSPTIPWPERNCGEKAEGFPHMIKRKRQGRARGTEERLKALRRDARVFRKMAKKRAKATTTNTASSSISTKFSAKQPKHMAHAIPEPSDDDLVDFRGLAILPRCYTSLLERACIGNPDLAICPKRSLRWREFAYETLGELLFFLTSTRRREMIKKACEHLQILWEEAQGLGFDLSWLTPIVNSCLTLDSSNSDVDNISTKMETWKKHKNTLHCQLTTLTMQMIQVDKGLAALEVALQRAKEEQERFLFTGL